MTFDTKADFDAAYKTRVERYFGGHPPDRPEVVVHYHRFGQASRLADMWANLLTILSPNIGSGEAILVAGAGFGWGIEAIVSGTGSTNVVGLDVSAYIQAEKANTEEAELRAEVALVGLDPDTGRELELMGHINDGLPRANIIVLDEDARTNTSRQAIRRALGNGNPTVVIYEDLFDDSFTDTDIVNARNAGNGFGGQQRLIFVYRATPVRSHQNFLDLLPGSAEVISPDGSVYLVK